jgi:hypothetical protein
MAPYALSIGSRAVNSAHSQQSCVIGHSAESELHVLEALLWGFPEPYTWEIALAFTVRAARTGCGAPS